MLVSRQRIAAFLLIISSVVAAEATLKQPVIDVLEGILARRDRCIRASDRILTRELAQIAALVRRIGVAGNIERLAAAARQFESSYYAYILDDLRAAVRWADPRLAQASSDWFRALPARTQRNRLARYNVQQLRLIVATLRDDCTAKLQQTERVSSEDLAPMLQQVRELNVLARRNPGKLGVLQRELEVLLANWRGLLLASRDTYWQEVVAITERLDVRGNRLLAYTESISV